MSSLFEPAPEPSDVPQNVTNITSRLAKKTGSFIERAPREGFDAADALRDMRVPEPPRSSLCAALTQAGYEVKEEELVHLYDRDYVSKVLAVRAPRTQRVVYLIHISPQILNEKKGDFQRAVLYLEYLFPAGVSLTVVSMRLPDPQGTYIKIFDGWRTRHEGVNARFVSWRRIEEFEENDFQPDEVVRDLLIRDERGAAAAAPAGDSGDGPSGSSIGEHEEEIASMLEGQARDLPAGSDVYIEGMITRLGAELPPRWSDQLAGGPVDARSASIRLVRWAIRKGEVPERPGVTVIGLLMAELSEDVGAVERAKLLELIEQYELLPAAEIDRRRGG
jgi:hypothetical protein